MRKPSLSSEKTVPMNRIVSSKSGARRRYLKEGRWMIGHSVA